MTNIFNLTGTKESIITQVLLGMANSSTESLEEHIESAQRGYNIFWYHKIITPQDFCEVLGNKALGLFIKSEIAQNYFKAMKPAHIKLEIPEKWNVEWYDLSIDPITGEQLGKARITLNTNIEQ